MLRVRPLGDSVLRLASRRFATAAPQTSTGIEHAHEHQKRGLAKPVDPKLYKCEEYLHFNKYSFYDHEVTLESSRVAQPNPSRPDVQPKVTSKSS